MQQQASNPPLKHADLSEVEELDPNSPVMHKFYLPMVKGLTRYHRCSKPLPVPQGPCIYVTHHGFGYLSSDIAIATYMLGWQRAYEHGGEHVQVRTTIAKSNLERAIPFLGRMRQHVGGIDPVADTMVAALQAGQQIVMTPGGRRECQPSRGGNPYTLRWNKRLGFARIAMRAGVPIVPLAIVGPHRAFPGISIGKLSLWSPMGLPARFQLELGTPIPVPPDPQLAHDDAAVSLVQQQAWQATQALYDRIHKPRAAR